MSRLWTPPDPKVSREHHEGTRAWEQSVLGCMHMVGPVLDHWNVELKLIDPNLRLMQAQERARAVGVLAGYYHLVRLRDPMRNEMLMVMPLRGPTGEFVEPSSQMLDALRHCDLRNEPAVAARRAADANAARSAERAEQRDDEDRADEGVERLHAATRTQVLMSPDVPWSQNNAPASRRDRRSRSSAQKACPCGGDCVRGGSCGGNCDCGGG